MVTTLYLIRHGETEGSGQMRYKGSIDVPMSEKGFEQIRSTSAFIQEFLKEASHTKYANYLYEVQKASGEIVQHPPLNPLPSREGKLSYPSPLRGEGKGEGELLPSKKDNKLPINDIDNESTKLSAVYTSGLSRAVTSAGIIADPYGLKPVVLHDLRERHFGIWEGMSFLEIRERHPETFEAWAENPLQYSPPGGESTIEVRDRVIKILDSILNRHQNEHIAVVAHGGVNRIILCYVLDIPLENIFRIEQDYGCLNIIEFWEKYPIVKLINGTKK